MYMRYENDLGNRSKLVIVAHQCATTRQYVVQAAIDGRRSWLQQFDNQDHALERFTLAVVDELRRVGMRTGTTTWVQQLVNEQSTHAATRQVGL